MQIDRLFGIVHILIEGKRTTAQDLASHFGVSKRTILRDLDTLTLAGIPLYTSQGKGGGIAILDHFVLNKAAISEHEQDQILIALQGLAAIQDIDAQHLLTKLSALFKKNETKWIEVDFSRWGNTHIDREKFEDIKKALLEKQAVTFKYYNSSGQCSNKTAYPLKLVFKAKAWYLQAFCLKHEDYRTYKINRINDLSLLNLSFTHKNLVAPPIDDHQAKPENLVELKLLFTGDMAYRIFDEFDAQNVKHNEDGTFTVHTYLPNDRWLQGFLLSFGPSLQVIGPNFIRDDLLTQLKKVEDLYKK